MLPTLFTVIEADIAPPGTAHVVTIFYNLLDAEDRYPPGLKQCQFIDSPHL